MTQQENDAFKSRIADLELRAKLAGFNTVEDAITFAKIAKEKTVVAWMHDGENRFDVVHDDVKSVWDKAKENHLEHYTIPLVRKD